MPYVRLSHDFKIKPEDASESEDGSTKVDLTTPPDLHAQSTSTSNDEKKEPTYTDTPCTSSEPRLVTFISGFCNTEFKILCHLLYSGRNIAEVVSKASKVDYETNHWSCRVPNMEVTGAGFYNKSFSREAAVVLLGK